AFCVFSGAGVTGLRRFLNSEARQRIALARMEEAEEAEEAALLAARRTIPGGDEDLIMTGLMSATSLTNQATDGGSERNLDDLEEELDDSVLTATNTPTPAADTIQPN
ncbi:hypothetical protein O988_07762, partial [Pseudogymnoascus sp. VKM F-3808]